MAIVREIMATQEMYQQCTLEKPSPRGGKVVRTIWGPSKYLQVGRQVKVEEDDGEWSQGWTVMAVYGEPLPEKYVRHQSHAHTRQRKSSDI